MELDEYIDMILEGKAVLLTGAGFSMGAKNSVSYNDYNFFSGNDLKKYLLKSLGDEMDPSDCGLSVLASYFAEQRGVDALIELIKPCFLAKSVADFQIGLMQLPWKRIYTTNYDNVMEVASDGASVHRKTIVLSMSKQKEESKNNIIVHLNGCVDNLNKDTIQQEFKLLDQSYASFSFLENEWCTFMERDFASAKCIIIIGHSMSQDLDIKREISTVGKEKVVFISGSEISEINKFALKSYGKVFQITAEEFYRKIDERRENFQPSILNDEFINFQYLYREPLDVYEISYSDCVNFFFKGEYKCQYFQKNNNGEYVGLVERNKVAEFCRNLYDGSVHIVYGDLGCGKSIFLDTVINELRKLDVRIFKFSFKCSNDVDWEIERICTQYSGRVLVIIDNCYSRRDIIKSFSEHAKNNILFLLAVRTSLEESAYSDVKRYFPKRKIYRYCLDTLDDTECGGLASIILNENLLPKDCHDMTIKSLQDRLKYEHYGRLADIVLSLYESVYVRNEFIRLMDGTLKDFEVRRFLIVCLFNAIWQLDLSVRNIVQILHLDFQIIERGNRNVFAEIFSESRSIEHISVKSSVVAQFLLNKHFSVADICDSVRELLTRICRDDVKFSLYKNAVKAGLSHGNFVAFLKDGTNKSVVKKFYDSLRNTSNISDNVFYWEEFALSCLDCDDYDTAKQCIATAYNCANKKGTGFVPFQVATIDADYLLRRQKYELSKAGSNDMSLMVDSIGEAMTKLLKYYEENKNKKSYVFTVGYKAISLFLEYQENVTQSEGSKYCNYVRSFEKVLSKYIDTNDRGRNLVSILEDTRKSIDIAKKITKQ